MIDPFWVPPMHAHPCPCSGWVLGVMEANMEANMEAKRPLSISRSPDPHRYYFHMNDIFHAPHSIWPILGAPYACASLAHAVGGCWGVMEANMEANMEAKSERGVLIRAYLNFEKKEQHAKRSPNVSPAAMAVPRPTSRRPCGCMGRSCIM